MSSRADVRAAWRAWRSYAGSGATTMAYLAARLAVFPRGALTEAAVALESPVLSVGAGHGLLERYLAYIYDDLTFEGYDVDGQRVAVAERTAGRVPRVRLHRADVTDLHTHTTYGGALAIDVLHHIEPDAQRRVFEMLHSHLHDGATCLVKDIARTPRWKYRWNAFHDCIVHRGRVHCRDPEEMAELARAAGFGVRRVERLAPFSPYPHVLVVVVKEPLGT